MTEQPVPPFWFTQRQGKLEPAGTDTYCLKAPNLRDAYLAIRKGDNGRWSAHLRLRVDGADESTTGPDFETPPEAWQAAFELYRNRLVI